MVKMKIIGFITILMLMCNYIECDDTQEESPSSCLDLKPQNNVDIDQVGVDFLKNKNLHNFVKHVIHFFDVFKS